MLPLVFLSLLQIIFLLGFGFRYETPQPFTPFLPLIPLPLTDNSSLTSEEINRVNIFKNELLCLEWRDLCSLSIYALKQVLPIWDAEVKFKYFQYADHVCGMRHKISTKTINNYIAFLENNPQLWGSENAGNKDILELYVSLTDLEFSISVKASYILTATYSLMSSVTNTERPDYFIEAFEYLFPLFGNWDLFEKFLASVKSDFQHSELQDAVI
ncbi:MAG: hypothetical protein LBJ00_17325 [Planctomycetaceae bacterium]|nr:hypothetical protein [Planctomycetaceae bacterium]